MLKLSVVTVTFNSEKFIGRLIKSLVGLPKDAEIIVVDSGSTDETVKVLKKYAQIKLIEPGQNVGFGKGCNLGTAVASGEYLLFLNPDSAVHPGAIDQLLEYANSHPDVGMVSPKLIEDSGEAQLSIRRLPTLVGAIKEYYFGVKGAYAPFAPIGDQPMLVECVVGAAILIKKQLFDQIGGFDQRYFMYYEDTELCRQVKHKGKEIVVLPKALVDHAVGASESAKKSEWNKNSSLIYHGWLAGQLLHLLLRFRLLR